MDPLIPESIVKAATINSYNEFMVILGVIVAFFFIVIIAKILPNRVQLFTAGMELKILKKYKFGDIIKINNIDWCISHFNSYRIIFSRVLEWDKKEGTIKLSQDEDLSIDYTTFYKMKIHRLGNCRS